MVDTDDVAVAASLQDTKRSDADFADDDMCGDGDDNGSCSGASGSRAGPCIDTGATSDAEGRNETESHKPFLFGRVSQFAGQVDLGNQDSGTSAYLEWSNSADDTAYCHAEQGLQSSSPEAVSYEGDSRITRLYPEQSQYVPADITIQQRDEFTSASVMLRTLFNSALTRTASASAENCKHPQPNFHHHIVTPGEQHGFNSDFHFRNNSALVTPAQERRQLLDSQGSSPQGVLQNGNSYSASVAKKATEENLALRMVSHSWGNTVHRPLGILVSFVLG